MCARPIHHLLLILALIFSQWAGLAHAAKHPALGDNLHVCQVCLHQQGVDHVTPPVPHAAQLIEARVETPRPLAIPTSLVAHHRHHPIRAPPVLSR